MCDEVYCIIFNLSKLSSVQMPSLIPLNPGFCWDPSIGL